MNDESSAVVIDLAKTLIEFMGLLEPQWKRAFFRFCSETSSYGSSASYTTTSDVTLIDPFKNCDFFDSMNAKGVQLMQLLGKHQGVFLIAVNSEFDYDVKFEYDNLDRWRITKLNGATGMPVA